MSENGETIDGKTGLPDSQPRRIDLSNLRDVRLELAHLYREIDAGRIKSQDGTRRAYVLRQIHDCIVSSELERRIDELEARNGAGLLGRQALPAERQLN